MLVAVAVAVDGTDVGFWFPPSVLSSLGAGGQTGPPGCPHGISSVCGQGITPPAASRQIGSWAWAAFWGRAIIKVVRKNVPNINKALLFENLLLIVTGYRAKS
ncbi:MAG: hypothetical protein IPP55_02065 [Anaerolineales bacterium]|nr:hypothetical protein [Anaerolineales bacterium]